MSTGTLAKSVTSSVQTPAALRSLDTSSMDDGELVYVESTKQHFALDKQATTPDNNTDVFYTLNSRVGLGPGRFLLAINPGVAGPDLFAPRYVVGNTLSGDSAIPQVGTFRYVPDPGDGSGIEAALALAAVNPGDVLVRPGVYTRPNTAAPLVVPAGVTLKGSGIRTTRIVGGQGADQGVVVATGLRASLRDLEIVGGGGGIPSVSRAVLHINGPSSILENVLVSATLDPGHQLEDGILVDVPAGGPAITDLLLSWINVTIDVQGVGNAIHLAPTNNAVVSCRTVATKGANRGLWNEGGSFVCKDFISYGTREVGLLNDTDNGSTRLDEGAFFSFPSPVPLAWVGIRITKGGGHVLRSLSIQAQDDVGNPLALSQGMYLGSPTSNPSAIQIDDCIVAGSDDGVILGEVGEAVFATTLTNSLIFVQKRGVVVGDDNSGSIKIVDNSVQVNLAAPGPGPGIEVHGGHHDVSGNDLQNGGALASNPLLFMRCQDSTVRGNAVSYQGTNFGALVTGDNNTVVGNRIDKQNPDDVVGALGVSGSGNSVSANVARVEPSGACPAVGVTGSLNTLNGNRTRTRGAPSVSGVEITGSNNTAVGHVCEGAAATPVNDLGVGNALGLNLGT